MNQHKLVAIYYSTTQLIFQPRLRKVLKRGNLLGLSTDDNFENHRGERFSIKAFISGGRLYTVLAENNNLPLRAEGRTAGRNIALSDKFRVGFLNDRCDDLDLRELPSTKSFSKHSVMQLHCLRGFEGLLLMIYRVEESFTAMVYKIEENEQEETEGDPEGHTAAKTTPNKKKTSLKQICELDQRAFDDRVLHDAFFIRRDLIGLVTNKDIIICKLFRRGEDQVNCGYWSIKVSGFNSGYKYRRARFDRGRGELHCLSGTEGGLFTSRRTIHRSLVVDLKPLLNDLRMFEDYVMLRKKGKFFSENYSEKVSNLQETLTLSGSVTGSEERNRLTL